jgi:MFS family permease
MSAVEAAAGKAQAMVRDSVKTVIAASMVGTAIEFYDFYAYGTAAANYFPKVFFGDTTNPTVALLASLLTFAIAFIARPLGSLVFGHFGDRMGRKTTLVVSLLTMGIATFLIGCLLFFMETIGGWADAMGFGANVGQYMIVGLVGANFIFELLFNVVLSPVVVRLIRIGKKEV